MAWGLRLLVVVAAVLLAVRVLHSETAPAYRLPPNMDALQAVTAIAAQQIHGWADDHRPISDLSRVAANRPVYVTCGNVSLWAERLLRDAGFTVRIAHVLTLDRWNGWANGHTFIEVRRNGRWVAYDIDRKVRWTDMGGRALSMIEWVAAVKTGRYRIVPLLGPVDETRLRLEDRRYGQVPFVRDGSVYWFPSQGAADRRILGYSSDYRVTSPRDWRQRFA